MKIQKKKYSDQIANKRSKCYFEQKKKYHEEQRKMCPI